MICLNHLYVFIAASKQAAPREIVTEIHKRKMMKAMCVKFTAATLDYVAKAEIRTYGITMALMWNSVLNIVKLYIKKGRLS